MNMSIILLAQKHTIEEHAKYTFRTKNEVDHYKT
jgi:hypothetical protein